MSRKSGVSSHKIRTEWSARWIGTSWGRRFLVQHEDEGRKVVKILRELQEQQYTDIRVEQRIGANECDPVELLALILREEFDLIHYSGHGDFDEKNPSKRGWILGKEHVLSD